mmetsp:Transcript_11435/g.23203  ORF Transcript_11435/g.23203 Transcript_11435/m.23203 type:complete len:141 (-) Transcript_11435:1189-1611(-)
MTPTATAEWGRHDEETDREKAEALEGSSLGVRRGGKNDGIEDAVELAAYEGADGSGKTADGERAKVGPSITDEMPGAQGGAFDACTRRDGRQGIISAGSHHPHEPCRQRHTGRYQNRLQACGPRSRPEPRPWGERKPPGV